MFLFCKVLCQDISITNFFLPNMTFLSQNTHQVRCYHFFIVEIIAEGVNLIQMSKWNRKVSP